MGHIGMVRMLAVVYGIACGISGTILSKHIGIPIGKNAFICYIKDVGMVCAEALERNRRDPSKKLKNIKSWKTVMIIFIILHFTVLKIRFE